jgi:hypothetical protein
VRVSGGSAGSISVAQKGSASTSYQLDACFGPESTNAQVYTQLIQPMVGRCANEGYDGVVLLGGPSMAGKAHTLHGTASEDGAFGLALSDIFANRTGVDLVTVAMYQVRLKGAVDLLNPEARVSLGVSRSGTKMGVRGVAEIVCSNAKEARELVTEGIVVLNIMQARHKMDQPCTLIDITITAGQYPDICESTLRFVLLAHCDGADGELKAFHRCAKMLATPDADVPYMDSVLCRVLEPAMRGQALICYLALVVHLCLPLTALFLHVHLSHSRRRMSHLSVAYPSVFVYRCNLVIPYRWTAAPSRLRMRSGRSKRRNGSGHCKNMPGQKSTTSVFAWLDSVMTWSGCDANWNCGETQIISPAPILCY